MKNPVEEWTIKLIPIVQLIHFEMRKGKEKPVIQKTLVDKKGGAFAYFATLREHWKWEDPYRYPGPIQFFGDEQLTDSIPITLEISHASR
jgi:pyrophosphate--fructose-6-phosphate 1-phosphotransferase